MSKLELAQGGYETIEAGIEEIKKTAWGGLSEAASMEALVRCLRGIVAKTENLRLSVQSALLVVGDGDGGGAA